MHSTTESRHYLKWRFKWLLAVLILLVALSSATVIYWLNVPATKPDPQWIRIDPKPIILRLGLVGRLEPASLTIFTAPFDGTVREKLASEGQRVERGQMLLRLDTSQLEIQLREALSGVLKAKRAVHDLKQWEQSQEVARSRRTIASIRTSLNNTERKLTETSALLMRGIVPRMEVDELEQQLNSQRLDLATAQAELELVLNKGSGENRQIAEMELANATAKYDALRALQAQRELVSPFAGVVMRVPGVFPDKSSTESLQRGSHVSRGQPLFSLANLEQLKVVAKVDEVDINQVQEGQLVEITGDGFDGLTLNGKIMSVGSQTATSDAPSSGATYDVTIAIPPLTIEQQKRLRLGMSAKLSIVIYRNDSAIVIPSEAIHKEGDQLFVEYGDAENKPMHRVIVKTGRATSEGIEVFGLSPGYVRKTTQTH